VGDDSQQLIEAHIRSGRALDSEQVFAWWRCARKGLLDVLSRQAGRASWRAGTSV
jgi:hypothetical protein